LAAPFCYFSFCFEIEGSVQPQIFSGLFYHHGIVMKEAEGAIATSAQNAADLFGCMVVIYTGSVCEFGQWRATYSALAFLRRKNSFIVFYRKAILTQ
jgi:hypothetical protein